MQLTIDTFLKFQKQVLQINENNFDEIAWRLFEFQAEYNLVYRQYLSTLKHKLSKPKQLDEIPFLPIGFFKSHLITVGSLPLQRIFRSSGTTASSRAYHHVWDENFYLHHALKTFENRFGSIKNYHVLCLLPSYDTTYSSLVAMARYFVAQSESAESGFVLTQKSQLSNKLEKLKETDRKVLLLGVTHALLDWAETGPFSHDHILVMETGGMKGRKTELTRQELHDKLRASLGVQEIISEYGMTELLSQAYTNSGNTFIPAPTMRVFIKEVNDPFSSTTTSGTINIIDLANIHSCCFIETQDLGRLKDNGFEVLGRVDNSEMRGCNLLIN